MKKAYMKPEIMFESFSASENIAAGCDVVGIQDENGWRPDEQWDLGSIFSDEVALICELTPTESGYDGLCYHAPSESYNLFTS